MALILKDLSLKLAMGRGVAALFGITGLRYAATQSSSEVGETQQNLMKFFEDKKYWGESRVRCGRSWRIDELRLKSNSDLHKLWFVLYKEKNMLLTMQEDARSQCEVFPNPERVEKVEESMSNLENVVRERNQAYWHLEVSPQATGERRSVFRRDVFGRHRWHRCSQHLIPYRLNKIFRETQGPGKVNETDWFIRRYKEKELSKYNAFRSRRARHIRELLRRFPDTEIEYLEELYPEFPAGYIKYLKNNLDLYDDPPTSSLLRHKQLSKAIKELDSHAPRIP